ncbi:MAG: hypothetical protein AUF79_19645 [Crenarchaeota archaeon 13_1_20CM_2_51_8]|nr:MAG: hypothetical protein AUF79_19645 [Crenarchaeota archaeon 13_1_20CM_2_51_8]
MEKTKLSRIRLTIISAALLLVLSIAPILSVRAEGTLLRGFDVPTTVPEHTANYWPIGVAFDGTNIYYSEPSLSTSDIFYATTSGTLLNTLHEVNNAGALAWDGTHLWVGIFSRGNCESSTSGCTLVWEVNPATGNIIKTLDLTPFLTADGISPCAAIDGLDYDSSTGTLWVSPDIGCSIAVVSNPCTLGFVYHIDTNGNLLDHLRLPYGVAGLDKVGNYLYLVTCGGSATSGQRVINKTTLDGTIVSSFTTVSVSGVRESAEDLAFDPITFAPACALWVMQDYGFPFDASLAAYQIACS